MDSFPAHAIIPSEVKATPEFEEADIPQRNRHVPRHFTATMSCSFDVGSKMDRYEHHPMWCTMFAIAEGALAMAACFPAWGRQRSGGRQGEQSHQLDRALLILMTMLWPRLLGAAQLVQLETILRWHRAGFNASERWKGRDRPFGRPTLFRDTRLRWI
jgi:hypothetical protein